MFIFSDDDHVHFVVDQHECQWVYILVVLAHWNNSPREDLNSTTQLRYIIMILIPLLYMLSGDFIVIGLTWPGLQLQFTTLETGTLTITPMMRSMIFEVVLNTNDLFIWI